MDYAAEADDAMRDIFGDSSSDESSLEVGQVEGVEGLYLVKNIIGQQCRSDLEQSIERDYNFRSDEARNQAMSWGNLPPWVDGLVDLIAVNAVNRFPWAMCNREPLFDQMIINVYHPGQGIKAHVDLAKFDDGIASVSLGSTCVMLFARQQEEVPVLLEPGDLLLMCGPARYEWTHAINEVTTDLWNGSDIPRGRRVSITLRRMLPIEIRPPSISTY